VAVDLDETEDGSESTQEAEPFPLDLARWIGLVAEIGMQSLGEDLVVNNGDP
jgi:hypothetical protein